MSYYSGTQQHIIFRKAAKCCIPEDSTMSYQSGRQEQIIFRNAATNQVPEDSITSSSGREQHVIFRKAATYQLPEDHPLPEEKGEGDLVSQGHMTERVVISSAVACSSLSEEAGGEGMEGRGATYSSYLP